MWSLKFKVRNQDSIYTLLSNKHKIVDYMYPVDHFTRNNKVYILGIHLVEGKEIEIKRFASALKRNKKTKRFQHQGNQIITLISEEEEFYKVLFNAELYHPAPVVIEQGYEIWHIAAWDRAKLEKIIKMIGKWKDKFSEFQMYGMKKSNLKEIYFPRIFPELPEKQKKAFHLALEKGYYAWPRKTHLDMLAQHMKISIATFQEHLRKAEAKLLPLFAENLGK